MATKKRKAPPKAAAKPVAEPAPMQPVTEVTTPTAVPQEPPVLEMKTAPEPKPEAPKHHGKTLVNIGVWSYLLGLVVALAAAIYMGGAIDYYTYTVLAILGFIVGLLNITDDEVLLFLAASLVFIVSANSVRTIIDATPVVAQFLANVVIFTAASAFIVSIKAIIKVSRDE